MLLTIDVGNTNITLGVFENETLKGTFRMTTKRSRTSDEYGFNICGILEHRNIMPQDIKDVIIASVVPDIMHSLTSGIIKYLNIKPIIVSAGIKTGIRIVTENPKEIGPDRIVDAVAGYEQYGGPIIVVDFGTATTFCCISEKCEYLGGTLAPGIKISSDALVEKTAKLPRVELIEPGHVICRNTIESMQSGLVYGHMGLVDFIINNMKEDCSEMTGNKIEDITVVATGGLATMVSKGVKSIDHVDRLLTLEGLSLIYEKNKNNFGNRNNMSRENIQLRAEE